MPSQILVFGRPRGSKSTFSFTLHQATNIHSRWGQDLDPDPPSSHIQGTSIDCQEPLWHKCKTLAR